LTGYIYWNKLVYAVQRLYKFENALNSARNNEDKGIYLVQKIYEKRIKCTFKFYSKNLKKSFLNLSDKLSEFRILDSMEIS